jgi:hypothetical protein
VAEVEDFVEFARPARRSPAHPGRRHELSSRAHELSSKAAELLPKADERHQLADISVLLDLGEQVLDVSGVDPSVRSLDLRREVSI